MTTNEGQANCLAFFLTIHLSSAIKREEHDLSENSNKREQAESAFGKTQSQFMARNRVISEHDAVVRARDEKTLRLRELRLAKEADEAAAAAPETAATPEKR